MGRSSGSPLLGIVILGAVVVPFGQGPATVEAAQEQPAHQAMADARQFRAALGLASDSATVRASLTDGKSFPNRDFHAPLSPAEAAELQRRAETGDDIDPAAIWADTHLPAYAGAWIDHTREGLPVFMVKNGDAVAEREIRDRLPSGLDVEFRPARHSLRELNALQDTINGQWLSLRDQGISIVSTSIQTPSNTVEVGLEQLTAEAEALLRATFGDAISIVRDHPVAHADACPTTDCGPLKGGIQVYDLFTDAECTSGFNVRVTTGSDWFGTLVAGHCFRRNKNDASLGQANDWLHPKAGADLVLGDAHKQTWYNGANADVGLIKLTNVPTDKNNIWSNGLRDMTATEISAGQQIGDAVCRTGKTSSVDCGHIIDTDETMESELQFSDGTMGTRNIDHQWVVDFDSLGGDSGGPYYFGFEEWGIHTHSRDPGEPGHPRSWYSPINWAQNEYQNRWGVAFVYCVTDAC